MLDFPGGSDGKASVYNVGDLGLIPGSGRFSGEGNGNPLKYSCLECFIATLSIRPTLCIPLCVQSLFSVYICVYTPALRIGSSVPFSRFHIYAFRYHICFSLSDLLHSLRQALGSSTSLELTQMCSFLWLSNILLYICTTASLSIHLRMDI